MHKDGHAGISLLLASPIIALFIAFDLYALCVLFVFVILTLTSFPDVDIHLQKFDDVDTSSFSVAFWHWIPVLKLSVFIMTIFGRWIDRVPRDYKLDSVSHRGITHTLWFSLSTCIISTILAAGAFATISVIDLTYDTQIYSTITEVFRTGILGIMATVSLAGILGPAYHVVGDTFTPMGINYLTPQTDYGFTLDQFYANNKVANRSALPLSLITVMYAVYFGAEYGRAETAYLIGGFIGLYALIIPLWLIFVRTRIGKWFYVVYDFFK